MIVFIQLIIQQLLAKATDAKCFVYMYTGMLSKSRGQILRVAATLHVLFHLDTPLSIPATISDEALKAAQEFVETSNQHVACLAGRGDITEAIEMFQELKQGMYVT